ncbi:MAG: matrixin family metalloprotease [Myxococcales bacterium]|nr:matrixin family metalloprotease [Myxococcales bacterium]
MLGLAVGLTPAGPAAAYTLKRAPSGAVVHWETAHLDVFLGPPPDGIEDAQMRLAARRAAAAWSRPSAPLLVVASTPASPSYAPGRPGVDIRVQSPWPHARGLLATTMTMYDEGSGALLDADVLINPTTRLTVVDQTGATNRWDLQALLTHELGHVQGLGESDVRAATMWAAIGAGDLGPRDLSGDDRSGLDAIYEGRALSSPAGCTRGSVTAPGARPEALGVLALLLALLGLASLRRRAAAPLSLAGAGLLFFYLPSIAWTGETASPAAAQTEESLDRWTDFAGATVIAPARVEGAFVGEDGLHRTRLSIDGSAIEVLGGCVDGVCMRFGDEPPPEDGEEVLFAPATGAWAHVRGDHAFGGSLGPGPALRLSRGAI